MANKCELLINNVIKEQTKDADRLEPKWCTVGYLCEFWGYTVTKTSEETQGLTYFVTQVKPVSPYHCPSGQANRKEYCERCG